MTGVVGGIRPPCWSNQLAALASQRRASAGLPNFWWASANHSQFNTARPGRPSATRLRSKYAIVSLDRPTRKCQAPSAVSAQYSDSRRDRSFAIWRENGVGAPVEAGARG